MKTYGIILASGSGTRFGGNVPKQFVRVGGRMIIEYTLDVFMCTQAIDEIIVVVSEPWMEEMSRLSVSLSGKKPVRVVAGGATRMKSCENGVAAIVEDEAKVVIHNAVQPFITTMTLDECVRALNGYDAVSVGSPCVYTILELDDNREILRIIPRSHSVNDLGPECFRLSLLRRAFKTSSFQDGMTNVTGLVLRCGLGKVYVVDGDPANIKITYPDDLDFAERRLLGKYSSGDMED